MRALVTGATGFVGGYLIEHLLASGDEVLATAAHGAWSGDIPAGVRQGAPLWAWDLAVDRQPPSAFAGRLAAFAPQAVYHLAGLSIPDDCGDEEPTAAAWRTNVEAPLELLEYLTGLADPPRVLLVSSSHVYAPRARGDGRVTEEAAVGPRRAYGKTKRALERALVGAGVIDAVGPPESGGVPLPRLPELRVVPEVIVARSFQHTGPRQSPRMMLPQWAQQFARGGPDPVQVYTLDAFVDMSDVRDIVRGYRLLLTRGTPGMTYNLGSGVERRSGEVFEALRRLDGAERGCLELRPGIRQEAIADIARLERETNWRPQIPWEQTLSDTLNYWRRRRS